VRQLARKSALNARAREGAMHVIERLAFRGPRTAQLVELLRSLGLAARRVLVLTAEHNANAYLSGRNLPNVDVMAYHEASAYDILWSEAVVVEEGALTGVMPEPLPDEPEADEAPVKAPKAKRAAPPKPPKAAKPAKAKSAKKSASKPAAKAKAAKKSTAKKKAAGKPAKKSAPKKKKGNK
jgi:Ribosomal protein L4/L1 family